MTFITPILAIDARCRKSPQPGGFVGSGRLFLVVSPFELLVFFGFAVSRDSNGGFVVEHEDVFHAHQLSITRLQAFWPSSSSSGSLSTPTSRAPRVPLAMSIRSRSLKALVVGDMTIFGFWHVADPCRLDQLAGRVVAVRVVGIRDLAVDRRIVMPRRHDQETFGETSAGRRREPRDGLPSDQHRHHGVLPAPVAQL